jgi:hypothetical protein
MTIEEMLKRMEPDERFCKEMLEKIGKLNNNLGGKK